jgi:hypothetical protein
VLLILPVAVAGWGGGSGHTHPDNSATPKGTFVLTVAAAFRSGNSTLTQSATINLMVQ